MDSDSITQHENDEAPQPELDQQQLNPPPSSTSHTRKQPANHIPRPPNAFILFRTDFVRTNKLTRGLEHDHRNISKVVGAVWRSLPPDQKAPWNQMAEEEKIKHLERYPGYRYAPVLRREGIARRRVKQDIWEGIDSDEEDDGGTTDTSLAPSLPFMHNGSNPTRQTHLKAPDSECPEGLATIPSGNDHSDVSLLTSTKTRKPSASVAPKPKPTSKPKDRSEVIAKLYLSGIAGPQLEEEIRRREEEGRRRKTATSHAGLDDPSGGQSGIRVPSASQKKAEKAAEKKAGNKSRKRTFPATSGILRKAKSASAFPVEPGRTDANGVFTTAVGPSQSRLTAARSTPLLRSTTEPVYQGNSSFLNMPIRHDHSHHQRPGAPYAQTRHKRHPTTVNTVSVNSITSPSAFLSPQSVSISAMHNSPSIKLADAFRTQGRGVTSPGTSCVVDREPVQVIGTSVGSVSGCADTPCANATLQPWLEPSGLDNHQSYYPEQTLVSSTDFHNWFQNPPDSGVVVAARSHTNNIASRDFMITENFASHFIPPTVGHSLPSSHDQDFWSDIINYGAGDDEGNVCMESFMPATGWSISSDAKKECAYEMRNNQTGQPVPDMHNLQLGHLRPMPLIHIPNSSEERDHVNQLAQQILAPSSFERFVTPPVPPRNYITPDPDIASVPTTSPGSHSGVNLGRSSPPPPKIPPRPSFDFRKKMTNRPTKSWPTVVPDGAPLNAREAERLQYLAQQPKKVLYIKSDDSHLSDDGVLVLIPPARARPKLVIGSTEPEVSTTRAHPTTPPNGNVVQGAPGNFSGVMNYQEQPPASNVMEGSASPSASYNTTYPSPTLSSQTSRYPSSVETSPASLASSIIAYSHDDKRADETQIEYFQTSWYPSLMGSSPSMAAPLESSGDIRQGSSSTCLEYGLGFEFVASLEDETNGSCSMQTGPVRLLNTPMATPHIQDGYMVSHPAFPPMRYEPGLITESINEALGHLCSSNSLGSGLIEQDEGDILMGDSYARMFSSLVSDFPSF